MGEKTDRYLGALADIAFGQPAVADPLAPTTAEAAALTRIECDILGDGGVDTPRSGSEVSIIGLCELESASIAGLITNGMPTFQGYRHKDGTDDFWVLMDDGGALDKPSQTLMIARSGFSGALGAPADTDVVDVYTVQVAARQPDQISSTSPGSFSVELTVLNIEFDSVLVTP
jgi:hypothetical protein